MDREEALEELPSVYALLLRWRRYGVSDAAIAERLEVEPSSVPLLVRLAEAKLMALLAEGRRAEG